MKNHLDYLNYYQDEIYNIHSKLKELINTLKYEDITNELLKEYQYTMDEICDIFNHHAYTNKVAPIFDDLSKEISYIDINNLSSDELSSFDILEKIFEEINEYIYLYFIQRTIVDVTIFKDSLDSNIKYFLSQFNNEDDLLSEIEFF